MSAHTQNNGVLKHNKNVTTAAFRNNKQHKETQICSASVQRHNLLTFKTLYAYSLQVPVVRGGGPC